MTRVAVDRGGRVWQGIMCAWCARVARAELAFVVDPDLARAAEQAARVRQRGGSRIIARSSARWMRPLSRRRRRRMRKSGARCWKPGSMCWWRSRSRPTLEEADRLIAAADAQRPHSAGGASGTVQSRGDGAGERAIAAAVFRDPPDESCSRSRSLDVDVVLDLMIHDLDIVLALARAELKEIRAAGISILSPKVDIANVRLEFADGCVANLTASRVSTERVRKLRLFQPRQYISIDYAKQDRGGVYGRGAAGIEFEQIAVRAGRAAEAAVRCVSGFGGDPGNAETGWP